MRLLHRHCSCFALAAALLLAAGCAPQLMRTPNLYADSHLDPWDAVPPALQSAEADVIYATDRSRLDHDSVAYGYDRSTELKFGFCSIQFGDDLAWDELVRRSRARHRGAATLLRVTDTVEVGQFPATPWPVARVEGRWTPPPQTLSAFAEAQRAFQNLVAERLQATDRKEAYVYIHGFNVGLHESAIVIGELWHFLGRRGVPIVYSWPAGSGLSLRGYNYDCESGEFTVLHLKQFLETLAATPGLERVHLIAHSRGAAVLTTALRELGIKYRAASGADRPTPGGVSPGGQRNGGRAAAGGEGDHTYGDEREQPPDGRVAAEALRIGQIVLAAPDIDFEVARQRLEPEQIVAMSEQLTVYTSPDDLALAIAQWLFASTVRLGTLGLAKIPLQERLDFAKIPGLTLIDARVSSDLVGHSYFYQNPAVSSDLILLLRDGLLPGAEHGRPLEHEDGFWIIRDNYARDSAESTTRRRSGRAEAKGREEPMTGPAAGWRD